MKKIDGLSTVVWVSVFVQRELPLRVVCCFGQNSGQKVLAM